MRALAAWILTTLAAASGIVANGIGPRALPQTTLDGLFDDPILSRALVGVRVESIDSGRLIYERNGGKLVMPASNMKLLTLSAAAQRLGWDFRYETRLETSGTIANGTLNGDLIVVGSGDPSIGALDFAGSPVFNDWAAALWNAGIRRVAGRLIGDDDAFDDEGLGGGWAWDYLSAGYAAPSGALSYNENVAVVRVWPGAAPGEPARYEVSPPGHGLQIVNELSTGAAGSRTTLDIARPIGSARLTLRGNVPAGGAVITRTTAIERPTQFFVDALRAALANRGIAVTGGAWDIDEVSPSTSLRPSMPPASGRRVLASRQSLPLSALGAYFLKTSQNFYGEQVLKTLGHRFGAAGTIDAGRQIVRETLESWGIAADSFVMLDGSGLSRYDFVTSDTIVAILKHAWADERLRGSFVAALPIAGWDGTLETRMKGTALEGHVQAKTGTISNVRSLSGYLITASGERLVFSIIVNNFTASTAQVDAVVEKALTALFKSSP